MFFFFFNENVQVKLGASPKDADVAIVSINSEGAIGELNQMVLRAYGYDQSILKQLNLGKGFDLFQLNGKPILFVVTVGIGNPINNLNENLKQAIRFHIQTLSGKKIWIPLMATGIGNLSYTDSYKITIKVLEELKSNILNSNCEFIISLPDNEEGNLLYKQMEDEFDNMPSKSKLENSDIDVNNNPKDINRVIEELNANYYFVGVDWSGKKQTNRFYKNGIWETGYDDRFTGIIKNILVGDILIIKEPYEIRGKSYTKIIAIGKVTDNPMNGTSVNVDWIVKKISFEIEAKGYNSSTITTAHLDSVKEIFSKIKTEELQKIKPLFRLKKRKKLESTESSITSKPYTATLPGILHDSETGEDYLDIKKDVEAFARVMAAKSFIPPLAIALLGKWGSGKSFFMQKLKEDIQKLSVNNPQQAFCEGITHVHFNAWSYMDANLWASIVTRIFEGLHEYISGDNLAKTYKKEIALKLTQNLNISKDELRELEKQKKDIRKKLFCLYKDKRKVEKELKNKIDEIEKKTLIDIIKNINNKYNVESKIQDALDNNKSFVETKEKFSKIVPKEYWSSPEELYNQLKSKETFFRSFFKSGKWKNNLKWLMGIILIMFFSSAIVITFVFYITFGDFTFSPKIWAIVTILGTLYIKIVDTYKKLQPIFASFWKIKNDYETEKENALFEFNQKEKALILQIENSKEEIDSITQQIIEAQSTKSKIEFKIEHALSTEALFTFIERRANSEDYKKHLGIVSIIRKDFEILSDLLTTHNIEATANKGDKEFKEMFEKPLERIILYIDDLDRCPEDRVVEVLEAVNLLMAFPLFVVVVGVDPRWVKNALHKKYQNQFSEEVENEDKTSSSNYLEKIFQVPFHLKDADDNSIKNMIEKLAKTKQNLALITNTKEQKNSINLDSLHEQTDELNENNQQEITKTINTSTTSKTNEIINEEQIQALDITDQEIEQIKTLTEIIGNNPRAIKRFVNIYRIAKTHEDFDYNVQTEEKELLTIMFLLALSIGKFKDLMGSFEDFLGTKAKDSVLLNHYVNPPASLGGSKVDKLNKRKNELKMILQNSNEKTLQINVPLFRKHNSFIKRFTYNSI